MKAVILRKLPKTLEQLMRGKNITPKELAQKSKMSYSSLMPILSGTRECGISKLIALADALECDPNTLLKDLYQPSAVAIKKQPGEQRFFAVFISIVRVTYCLIYDTKKEKLIESVQQFPLRCGDEADLFLKGILTVLEKCAQDLKVEIAPQKVAVFVSVQQYGRRSNREKIQYKGDSLFGKFVMESDATSNHHAFIGDKNGICISINDGCVITYSIDHGENINRLQGYGFPISDTAGNYWIGCEAIKHVVNVKEQREQSSAVSDRLLAAFNDDLIFLCASALDEPHETYLKASSIVKEMVGYEGRAQAILRHSAETLLKDVAMIDKMAGEKLPIFISGELACLYDSLFPSDRLISIKERQHQVLLQYGLNKLKQAL